MAVNFVGITMGDPAGIGPEISLKAIDAKTEYQQYVLIYGSYDVLQYYHQRLQLTTPLVRIEKVLERTGRAKKVLTVRNILVDMQSHQVYKDGLPVSLKPM